MYSRIREEALGRERKPNLTLRTCDFTIVNDGIVAFLNKPIKKSVTIPWAYVGPAAATLKAFLLDLAMLNDDEEERSPSQSQVFQILLQKFGEQARVTLAMFLYCADPRTWKNGERVEPGALIADAIDFSVGIADLAKLAPERWSGVIAGVAACDHAQLVEYVKYSADKI